MLTDAPPCEPDPDVSLCISCYLCSDPQQPYLGHTQKNPTHFTSAVSSSPESASDRTVLWNLSRGNFKVKICPQPSSLRNAHFSKGLIICLRGRSRRIWGQGSSKHQNTENTTLQHTHTRTPNHSPNTSTHLHIRDFFVPFSTSNERADMKCIQ